MNQWLRRLDLRREQGAFAPGCPAPGAAGDGLLFDAVYSWSLSLADVAGRGGRQRHLHRRGLTTCCVPSPAAGSSAACCYVSSAESGARPIYFVSVYRGTPVLPWDLTALGTASAVSSSYDFTPTWQMALSIAGVVVVCVLLWRKAGSGRLPLVSRLACVVGCLLCLIPILQPTRLGWFGVKTDVWDQTGAYRTSGSLATFLRNTEFMEVEEPEDTSVERLGQIMEQAEQTDIPLQTSVDRPVASLIE